MLSLVVHCRVLGDLVRIWVTRSRGTVDEMLREADAVGDELPGHGYVSVAGWHHVKASVF